MKILVATDGSKNSLRAVRYAASFGHPDLWIGSVAQRVLATAKQPVVVVK